MHERSGKYPLSVSSDMVALIAMRCATLLGKLGVTDRSGGKVVEVYPGASLRVWQLAGKVKVSDTELLARLLARTSEWLRWDEAELAREEGWIALPIAGSLERLCRPPTQ